MEDRLYHDVCNMCLREVPCDFVYKIQIMPEEPSYVCFNCMEIVANQFRKHVEHLNDLSSKLKTLIGE